MLLFAHMGITLGIALTGKQICRLVQNHTHKTTPESDSDENAPPKALKGLFDLRFWLIGSMLPDIIDKPVGHFIFNETFHGNGRIFSHTLLFFLVLLGIGLYMAIERRKNWVLALSLGVLMHLVLDTIWQTPQTFFWPLLGWNFPWYNDSNWAWSLLDGLLHNPTVFIPEIMGIIIFGGFTWKIIRSKRVRKFLIDGD